MLAKAVCQPTHSSLIHRLREQARSHIIHLRMILDLHEASHAEGLHGSVELPAEDQQVLALAAALANAQQVILA